MTSDRDPKDSKEGLLIFNLELGEGATADLSALIQELKSLGIEMRGAPTSLALMKSGAAQDPDLPTFVRALDLADKQAEIENKIAKSKLLLSRAAMLDAKAVKLEAETKQIYSKMENDRLKEIKKGGVVPAPLSFAPGSNELNRVKGMKFEYFEYGGAPYFYTNDWDGAPVVAEAQRSAKVEAADNSLSGGAKSGDFDEMYDIPTFLRKQAD